LPGLLTDGSLLRLTLGSTEMLRDAKQFGCNRKRFSVLENNLVLCVCEAFPASKFVEHPKQRRLNGKKFSGFGFAIGTCSSTSAVAKSLHGPMDGGPLSWTR
jgi:hypothetical protein